MRKITLEEHFSTPELSKNLVAKPTKSESRFKDIVCRLNDFDELRIETMDKAGIDLQVISVTAPGVQAHSNIKEAIRLAQQANDMLAVQIQKRPTRYAGFAHLATQDAYAAADELERAVKNLGFLGALINGQTNGHFLDEEMYFPFWERVQDLDVPIYIHPGRMADLPLIYNGHPELIGPIWSWGCDTAAHALRMVFAGTFKRYPRVKIILGHMGEMIPYFFWRLDSRWKAYQSEKVAPEDLPSTIIKNHFVITTSGVFNPDVLINAIAAMGKDNVMFSVDYPYEDTQLASSFIETAPISEEVRAKICYGTAERILKINLQSPTPSTP